MTVQKTISKFTPMKDETISKESINCRQNLLTNLKLITETQIHMDSESDSPDVSAYEHPEVPTSLMDSKYDNKDMGVKEQTQLDCV
ncbi:hypothetical protein CEXT_625381 [Caerostris extrusa]|uniref:Uncharacterized protein n=1 Tax=Caerostris extrusa TaxID=172846 RepID=A0AAV4TXN1_CAEEX|nr:hypothetical protein CEXT_625381 [Caerostris extrusa]